MPVCVCVGGLLVRPEMFILHTGSIFGAGCSYGFEFRMYVGIISFFVKPSVKLGLLVKCEASDGLNGSKGGITLRENNNLAVLHLKYSENCFIGLTSKGKQ